MQIRFEVRAIADAVSGDGHYTFVSEVYAISGGFFLLYNTVTGFFEWFGINDSVMIDGERAPRVTLYDQKDE